MVLCCAPSAGPLLGTPARIGKRPVIMADRAGAQTGALEYQLMNRAPDAASASICGVFRSVAPRQPRSWQPRSSATITMKFGRREPAACRNAGAAVAAIKSRREIGICLNLPHRGRGANGPPCCRLRLGFEVPPHNPHPDKLTFRPSGCQCVTTATLIVRMT